MKIIKNSQELAKLVDANKDLHLEDEDVRIEFEPTKEELRDVYCRDLYMKNDERRFDFNGRNFKGSNFIGSNFNGENFSGLDFSGVDFNGKNFFGLDFNGRNFTGLDFIGNNFNGANFDGRKISYYAFFICCGTIKCESYKARRNPHIEPICLVGEIEIRKYE